MALGVGRGWGASSPDHPAGLWPPRARGSVALLLWDPTSTFCAEFPPQGPWGLRPGSLGKRRPGVGGLGGPGWRGLRCLVQVGCGGGGFVGVSGWCLQGAVGSPGLPPSLAPSVGFRNQEPEGQLGKLRPERCRTAAATQGSLLAHGRLLLPGRRGGPCSPTPAQFPATSRPGTAASPGPGRPRGAGCPHSRPRRPRQETPARRPGFRPACLPARWARAGSINKRVPRPPRRVLCEWQLPRALRRERSGAGLHLIPCPPPPPRP